MDTSPLWTIGLDFVERYTFENSTVWAEVLSSMSQSSLAKAWQPLKIGSITLRNAFIKAATNENMSRKGIPTRAMLEHHRELAEGGVGMSTMAYLAVEKTGRTLADQIWLRPDILPELRAVTDAVHEAGGKIAAQITHGGSFVTGTFVPAPLKSASGGINAAGSAPASRPSTPSASTAPRRSRPAVSTAPSRGTRNPDASASVVIT